jgi:hypothetical protein
MSNAAKPPMGPGWAFTWAAPWAHEGPSLGPPWAHDGPMLSPCLGPHGSMMGPFLGHPWAHDGPLFSHLAERGGQHV